MNSQLYATLRERIVKVVPEIMELKFGCKIRYGENYVYSGNVHIDWKNAVILRRHWNLLYEIYEVMLPKDTPQERRLVWPKDWRKTDRHFEILGRDITLADVLRAINHATQFDASGMRKGHIISDLLMDKYESGIHKRQPMWNLALPLNEQSDELGEWLMTIIK